MTTKDDIWRLNHILEAIALVEQCVARKGQDDVMVEAALERFVMNIGEMCRGMTPEFKQRYTEIPWHAIISMRHILVHEYYKVDKETIWDVAENKIPALKDWIHGILEKEGKHNG